MSTDSNLIPGSQKSGGGGNHTVTIVSVIIVLAAGIGFWYWWSNMVQRSQVPVSTNNSISAASSVTKSDTLSSALADQSHRSPENVQVSNSLATQLINQTKAATSSVVTNTQNKLTGTKTTVQPTKASQDEINMASALLKASSSH